MSQWFVAGAGSGRTVLVLLCCSLFILGFLYDGVWRSRSILVRVCRSPRTSYTWPRYVTWPMYDRTYDSLRVYRPAYNTSTKSSTADDSSLTFTVSRFPLRSLFVVAEIISNVDISKTLCCIDDRQNTLLATACLRAEGFEFKVRG